MMPEEIQLREIENCDCPFRWPNKARDESGFIILCALGGFRDHILHTPCFDEEQRDRLRRRVLEFESEPQLGDHRKRADGSTQVFVKLVDSPAPTQVEKA